MNEESRRCQNCQREFLIEPEDFDFYKKINVPPPTFCPECRFQRRLAFRNERMLYRRKCDLCGKVKVSNFRPDTVHPVYCTPCWWSDKWDAVEYAQNYDPSRPFLEQFIELRRKVPQQGLAISSTTMINSEYCHMATDLKNCYLLTHANFSENSFYSSGVIRVREGGELLSCQDCELCLEDVQCLKCSKVYFSLDCESCHDVSFSRNCVGCSNCVGCVNLRNKNYHIFNQPLSKENYFKKLQGLNLGSHSAVESLKEKIKDFWQKFPQKYVHGTHNGIVTGDYIYHSKNTYFSYDVVYAEDSKYCQYLTTPSTVQCYDYTEWGDNAELVYESINCGQGFVNSKFGQQSWNECRNTEYTSFCIASADLFGCVSLRHKQYCILNKQYTKEEYESLVSKIVTDMNSRPYVDKKGRVYRYGEFLPVEVSFWGYNETTANEYFPMSQKEVEAQGYSWTEVDQYRGVYPATIKASQIPEFVKDATDSILKEIIECQLCKKSYRIIKQEFDFYKNQNIALPHECPECRYRRRFVQRNSFQLFRRRCQCAGTQSENGDYGNAATHLHEKACCPNEFWTSYSHNRPEIVYCEQCYNAEVV